MSRRRKPRRSDGDGPTLGPVVFFAVGLVVLSLADRHPGIAAAGDNAGAAVWDWLTAVVLDVLTAEARAQGVGP